MYFEYRLRVEDNIYLCIVEDDLVVGMSDNSFEEAVADAKKKLFYHNALPYNIKQPLLWIRIDYDEYMNFHKSDVQHILL